MYSFVTPGSQLRLSDWLVEVWNFGTLLSRRGLPKSIVNQGNPVAEAIPIMG
jgi:hypothetical protein